MAESFFVARSCTVIIDEQRLTEPLAAYRDRAAWVLLGDSGAGKTAAFKQEAAAVGGEYITARDFCAIGPKTDGAEQVLFIDGLDEMRVGAGDGNTALDQIRSRLMKLKRPRFRLSCRAADWLGASDAEALKQVSPDQQVIALHLNPLTEQDIADILKHKASVADAEEFVRQARQHGLEELLHNPQTLNLLVDAVAGNDQQWPQSRSQVYEMACQQLIREPNKAHRDVKKKANTLSNVALLDGVGYLCAVQLLAGVAGFALDDDAVSAQHVRWQDLENPENLPLQPALKTNLFQGTGDGQERRIPIHRSVAEFLGARYIAQAINTRGLPIGRVIALVSGDDGGVVPDLRGLTAWLAWHCRTARAQLIEVDALGVVLYGDVKQFPVEDKKLVLTALHEEAKRHPRFSASEGGAYRFGALGSSDMAHTFIQILASPSRATADQALLGCVLDAIAYGEPMLNLTEHLDSIIGDASYWGSISEKAAEARMQVKPNDHDFWLKIIGDIQSGTIKDSDDELLGMVLELLYPATIPTSKILDYLVKPKDENFFGAYRMFWRIVLPAATPQNELAVLLERILEIQHSTFYAQNRFYQDTINSLAGRLLVQCLTVFGDVSSDASLYSWLCINLGNNYEAQTTVQDTINQWFATRPARLKAIWAYGIALCSGQAQVTRCLDDCTARLYKFGHPTDMVNWCLESAAAQQDESAQYYFERAVLHLKQQSKLDYLTSENLELLNTWVEMHPNFQKWLDPFTYCSLDDWRRRDHIERKQREGEQEENRYQWICYFRSNLPAIYNGRASPGIFHQLALIYEGLTPELYGSNPHERLIKFFNGDEAIAAAIRQGLQQTLMREDLPTYTEIIGLAAKGQTYKIGIACIAGMTEFYQVDPDKALQLNDDLLARLLAFSLADKQSDDLVWVAALLKNRPDLVARTWCPYIFAMLRKSQLHLPLVYAISNNDAYADLAKLALPIVLAGFPARARKDQITNMLAPLLRSALHHLDHHLCAQLVGKKVALKGLESGQRIYWLACGLVSQPDLYKAKLLDAIGNSQVRIHNLVQFFYPTPTLRKLELSSLPLGTMALLAELLAPACSPQYPTGVYINNAEFETTDLVWKLINTLSGNPDASATQALEHLLTLPKLASWQDALREALHKQRIARRKASFSPVTSVEVSRMLANLQPANAADLAALVFDHLRDIARKIRDGNTNDYRQYWSYTAGNKVLQQPKPENDCRDALLSALRARLEKLGIDAQPEGSYADNKRADIRVSFNNAARPLNVPVEIKKDSHPDLWKAIHTQLIPRYVRDPDTAGQGIYLVFWFGGKGMPLPPDAKRPKSAKELEERLRGLLTAQERYHIHVCVIDCALPPSGKGDSSESPKRVR